MRNGASVSTRTRSSGATAQRVAQRLGVLEGHRAGEARGRRRGRGRPARSAASPEKQCITQRSGAPSSSSTREHLVVGVAVVDDQRLVEPLGQVDVPAERLVLRGPALRRRCGSGRARSRRPRAPCRAPAASRSISASASSSRPSAASRGASLGCSATPATSASCARRRLDRPPRAGQVAADLHDPRVRRPRRRAASASSTGSAGRRRRRRCRGGSGCRRPGAAAARAAAGARGRDAAPARRRPTGSASARSSRPSSAHAVHRVVHDPLGDAGAPRHLARSPPCGAHPRPRPVGDRGRAASRGVGDRRLPARRPRRRRWSPRRGRRRSAQRDQVGERAAAYLLVGLGQLAADRRRRGRRRTPRPSRPASRAVRCGASKNTRVRSSAASAGRAGARAPPPCAAGSPRSRSGRPAARDTASAVSTADGPGHGGHGDAAPRPRRRPAGSRGRRRSASRRRSPAPRARRRAAPRPAPACGRPRCPRSRTTTRPVTSTPEVGGEPARAVGCPRRRPRRPPASSAASRAGRRRPGRSASPRAPGRRSREVTAPIMSAWAGAVDPHRDDPSHRAPCAAAGSERSRRTTPTATPSRWPRSGRGRGAAPRTRSSAGRRRWRSPCSRCSCGCGSSARRTPSSSTRPTTPRTPGRCCTSATPATTSTTTASANEHILAGQTTGPLEADDASMVVHPEVGKWLIGARREDLRDGRRSAGGSSPAIVGSLMILVMIRLVRRLTGSTLLGLRRRPAAVLRRAAVRALAARPARHLRGLLRAAAPCTAWSPTATGTAPGWPGCVPGQVGDAAWLGPGPRRCCSGRGCSSRASAGAWPAARKWEAALPAGGVRAPGCGSGAPAPVARSASRWSLLQSVARRRRAGASSTSCSSACSSTSPPGPAG